MGASCDCGDTGPLQSSRRTSPGMTAMPLYIWDDLPGRKTTIQRRAESPAHTFGIPDPKSEILPRRPNYTHTLSLTLSLSLSPSLCFVFLSISLSLSLALSLVDLETSQVAGAFISCYRVPWAQKHVGKGSGLTASGLVSRVPIA